MTDREDLLAKMSVRTGNRGRPKQTVRELQARQGVVWKEIIALLRRPPAWGQIKELQQRVQRKHGIASSEFYKIVKQARQWLPIADRLAREKELMDKYITPAELDAWADRSADSVIRLARRRSRRIG